MKLALDYSFIGFVTNEAWNKFANPQCPEYSSSVCSLISNPKDLGKGHKLNKVKINQVYNKNIITEAFIYYKEAVVKEALEQIFLCSKGKSTARCQTAKWNPAGEAVFGAKRNQHLRRNISELLENGKGVWCWATEGVNLAFGPNKKPMDQTHTLWSCTSLLSNLSQGFTPMVSAAAAFASFTTWSMGAAFPPCGKLRSTVRGAWRHPSWQHLSLYILCHRFGEIECSSRLCDICGYIPTLSHILFIQMPNFLFCFMDKYALNTT